MYGGAGVSNLKVGPADSEELEERREERSGRTKRIMRGSMLVRIERSDWGTSSPAGVASRGLRRGAPPPIW